MLRSKTTKTSKKGISTGMWSITGKHGIKKGGYHTTGKTISGIGHGTVQYGKFSSNYPVSTQGGNVGLMVKNIPLTEGVNKTTTGKYIPSTQDVSGLWYTSNPQTLTGENYSSLNIPSGQVSPRTVTTTVTEYLPWNQTKGFNGYSTGSQELIDNNAIMSNDVLSNKLFSETEYLPVNQIVSGKEYSTVNQPVSGNVALLTKTMPSGQVFFAPQTAFLPIQYGTFSTGNTVINKPVTGKVGLKSKRLLSRKGISTIGTHSIVSYRKSKPAKKTGRYSK